MTVGLEFFISCKPFSEDRIFLLCFQDVFLKIVAKYRCDSVPRDVFLRSAGSSEQIDHAFATKPDKFR